MSRRVGSRSIFIVSACLLPIAACSDAGSTAGGDARSRPASPAAKSSSPPSRSPGGEKNGEGFVRVQSRDGPITATVFGRGPRGVVLSPQLNQDRRYWFPLARVLAERGYRAMSIDSNYVDHDGEVVAAAKYLRDEGVTWVAGIGASKGGTAVLAVASKGEIDAVVAVSPVVSFGDVTLTRRSVRAIDIPALAIVDELDGADNDVDDLAEWAGPALQVVHINAGAVHGTAYLDSEKRRAFLRTVVDFLDSHDGKGAG